MPDCSVTMELHEDIKAAKEVVNAILKTKKIIRMYPPNNPVYAKTLEETFNKFKQYFYYQESLVFKIRQNEIFSGSEQVYANSEKEDNLALFFFKDGLRELTFRKGLSPEEMEEFLKIISLDFEREVLDDDIVTLLWERDFQSIQYVVDEGILTDDEDYEASAAAELAEKTTETDNLLKAYEDAFREDEPVQDVTIVPLTDRDLQQLMGELERESQPKTLKLLNLLLEMFALAKAREDYEDVGTFLVNTIEFALRHGDIGMVTQALENVTKIADDERTEEIVRQQMRKVVFFAGSTPAITMLGEFLDTGQDLEENILEDFVKYLDKNAIVSFMKILGELKSIHARKIVIDALISLGAKDIMTLAKGLSDSRWYVVRNIIYILRKIGDKRSVDYLLKTVRHGDIRVRKEVIRALGELGGSGVIQTLRECLDDGEEQVRLTALKAFGTIGSEAARKILFDRISGKAFRDRGFDEKKEYLETVARWKDKETFQFLVTIFRKRTFFMSSRNDETRACAAYGLGLLGNRDAIPLLEKFRNKGNKIVREHVHTAMKRLEHG